MEKVSGKPRHIKSQLPIRNNAAFIIVLPKTYSPVGLCIYCGAHEWAPDVQRRLGDEHIVPEGISGRLLLPQSSCKACEQETSKLELKWLRDSPHALRVQRGFGKKKNRPDRYVPLKVAGAVRHIDIYRYPALFVTLRFDPPEILSGGEPQEKVLAGGVAIAQLPSFGEYLQPFLKEGSVSIEPPRGTPSHIMGRVLAKIAHSFAVAELGVNGFRPFLPSVILGTDQRYLAHFIGSAPDLPEPSANAYEISLETVKSRTDKAYWMTRLRFFADMSGMPEYWVVVGEPLLP